MRSQSRPSFVVKFIAAAALVALLLGITLSEREQTLNRSLPARAAQRRILYYVDPMNPTHTSGKPGLAPCGMKLEPVYAESTDEGSTREPKQGTRASVDVEAGRQQLFSIRVEAAAVHSGHRTVRTLGRVALDERRIHRLSAAVEGWVRSNGPTVTGSLVKHDEILATFYNRDFLTAQQTYFYALNTMDRFRPDENAEQMKLTEAQIRAAEENLQFLGMSESQLHAIAQSRQTSRDIEIRSPVDGILLSRSAYAGLRFERGSELFRVADISHVWVLADLLESERSDYSPGSLAKITAAGLARPVEGKVSGSIPQYDPTTRRMKVRLEVENPEGWFRPDMLVDVELDSELPSSLTVPREAVVDSADGSAVFLEERPGRFTPRPVRTGWHDRNWIEITSGLSAGDRVAAEGNFLLDSESRIKLVGAMPEKKASPMSGPEEPETTTRNQSTLQSKDPVCGMTVDVAEASRTGLHAGDQDSRVYFCSDACRKRYLNGTNPVVSIPPRHSRHGSPLKGPGMNP